MGKKKILDHAQDLANVGSININELKDDLEGKYHRNYIHRTLVEAGWVRQTTFIYRQPPGDEK